MWLIIFARKTISNTRVNGDILKDLKYSIINMLNTSIKNSLDRFSLRELELQNE